MFELDNAPREYDWGSRTALAEFRNRTPSGKPEAEVWLGDHPANPARCLDTGELITEREQSRFGSTGHIPFLVKILAADAPLSIQVHPSNARAREGFAAENAAGIPIDAPHRNYRDAGHKPEILIAQSDFSALCGFRSRDDRDRIIRHLAAVGVPHANRLAELTADGPKRAVEWLLARNDEVDELVSALAADVSPSGDERVDDAIALARELAERYPGDPGVAVSLLLNHVVLAPGEAIFLPAGNVHAYVKGLGIEVMATSDNVLRGGLTSKHIDISELLDVADFEELREPLLQPTVQGATRIFAPAVDDFRVTEITVSTTVPLNIVGPAVAVVVDGEVTVHCDNSMLTVTRGRAAFIEWDEKLTSVSGSGRVIIAHQP